MDKLKLCVLFGGLSSEHDVSLVSASSIFQNISREKYEVYPVGITRAGEWFYYTGDLALVEKGGWESAEGRLPAAILPDRSRRGLTVFSGDEVKTYPLDCVFPVLHGKNGEDGTLQGLLDLAGIPYVGCGVLSSAVCMDKAFTKLIADAAGLVQADWLACRLRDYRKEPERFLDRVEAAFSYPVFVKPANTGSSVGISKAKTREKLAAAIEEALRYDDKFLVEEFIDGRELETAVLGNGEPIVSCVGEVLPSREFYTYEAKYVDGTSGLVIPARLSEDDAGRIRSAALAAYRALDCSGLSRVDFFLRKRDNAVVFNEINTLPGFTGISMYAKLFAEEGLPYPELVERLIAYAVERGAGRNG